MTHKRTTQLTGEDWSGLPLCVRHFDAFGKASGILTPTDSVLVWGGGRSEVTVDYRERGVTTRHSFSRHSGMIDLLPAGTVLEHVEWHGQRTSCISALIPPERAPELYGDEAATLARDQPPRFGLIDAHVVDLVRRLEAQAIDGQALGKAYTEALSLTLVTYLSRRYGKGLTRARDEGSLSPSQRERVLDFVEQRLGGDISLADLAELAGYSADHFSRLFKRAFGESPYQYVLRRRVERAKAMLRDPSRSLADIATACGFATHAHLSNVFKMRTGLTPGAYRRG